MIILAGGACTPPGRREVVWSLRARDLDDLHLSGDSWTGETEQLLGNRVVTRHRWHAGVEVLARNVYDLRRTVPDDRVGLAG